MSLAVMIESSAARWERPRHQSPFKRRGGRRSKTNPPTKSTSRSPSAKNPAACAIAALRTITERVEKGKPHHRQAQRRTWRATTVTSEHDFRGGATVFRGTKELERSPHNPRERGGTINQHQIPKTGRVSSRAAVRKRVRGQKEKSRWGSSRATKPKHWRGQNAIEGRRWREIIVAENKGCRQSKGALIGSNRSNNQQQNGKWPASENR